jgi:hypothetical protein
MNIDKLYLCRQCGKLYYLDGLKEIRVKHTILVDFDWSKFWNRTCEKRHLLTRNDLKKHGNYILARNMRKQK